MGDRGVAQAIGGAQPAAQGDALPLGHVDADLLYQPRRLQPAGGAKARARESQGRTATALRQAEGGAVGFPVRGGEFLNGVTAFDTRWILAPEVRNAKSLMETV